MPSRPRGFENTTAKGSGDRIRYPSNVETRVLTAAENEISNVVGCCYVRIRPKLRLRFRTGLAGTPFEGWGRVCVRLHPHFEGRYRLAWYNYFSIQRTYTEPRLRSSFLIDRFNVRQLIEKNIGRGGEIWRRFS